MVTIIEEDEHEGESTRKMTLQKNWSQLCLNNPEKRAEVPQFLNKTNKPVIRTLKTLESHSLDQILEKANPKLSR